MTEDEGVRVETARIERLLDALSLASVEAFDDAVVAIKPGTEGVFALLEETIRLFVSELGSAHRERSEYLGKLEAHGAALEEKLAMIERQEASIQMLSTPVLELDDDILTLPIIGVVDSARAAAMTSTLLEGVQRRGARFVIVDLTGASILDAKTAEYLTTMVQSARLLGTTCVLAGVGPKLSIAAVRSGVEFAGVPTFRGLKEALRHCRRELTQGMPEGT